jgi:hypothetical protein
MRTFCAKGMWIMIWILAGSHSRYTSGRLTWSSTPDSANFETSSRSSQGFMIAFASSGMARLRPYTLNSKHQPRLASCQSTPRSLVPVDYAVEIEDIRPR